MLHTCCLLVGLPVAYLLPYLFHTCCLPVGLAVALPAALPVACTGQKKQRWLPWLKVPAKAVGEKRRPTKLLPKLKQARKG